MNQRNDWPFKLALLACIAAGVSVAAWLLGHGAARFIAGALWALWLYECLLVAAALQPLDVERTLPLRMMAGTDLIVRLVIQRRGWLPLLWVLPRDHWEGVLAMDAQRASVRSLTLWQRSDSWSYTIRGVPRGVHRVLGASIEIVDAFGFVSVRRWVPIEGEVIVHPEALDLPGCLPLPQYATAGGYRSGLQRGELGAVGGIEPYREGDPLARIHWPASLRQGSFYTKSFDPPADRAWLVVPCWHTEEMSGGDSTSFELIMTLTATALREAARIGVSVSLALPRQGIFSLGLYDNCVAGEDPAVAAFDALARCTLQDEPVNVQALLSHLPRASASILLIGTAIDARQAALLAPFAKRLYVAIPASQEAIPTVNPALDWLAEYGAQVRWVHEPRDLTLFARGDADAHRA
ncbi:uncharacterized protein (DUF58 family) [Alicyclobacillus sacchari]|uniref:Uncharacterized protein (DUF58 family) n=1 Tax=Alicyclobacillus sacchari TaxID=392010 RepID=A0A4R8LQX9_9BACL|nr:DUF58 domain-containing protein [Alicyclobacillus sacchari]TDY49973.1 uncharacterized protein (DUF58 family) [Alicyclobacillus sacchari]